METGSVSEVRKKKSFIANSRKIDSGTSSSASFITLLVHLSRLLPGVRACSRSDFGPTIWLVRFSGQWVSISLGYFSSPIMKLSLAISEKSWCDLSWLLGSMSTSSREKPLLNTWKINKQRWNRSILLRNSSLWIFSSSPSFFLRFLYFYHFSFSSE